MQALNQSNTEIDFATLGRELAAVTESVARSVMPCSGKGDKHEADRLAVEAMRERLHALPYKFRIVQGEGGKDEAPMLYSGEILGQRANEAAAPCIDLIVDPLECTTNFARGLPDSMSVLLAAPENAIRHVPGTYMEQLLVPPAARGIVDDGVNLDTPIAELVQRTAQALELEPEELCVVTQDRPRHKQLIEELRAAGAGVALIESGSISAAFEVIRTGTGRLHMLLGTFGAPEGVVKAFMAREAGCAFLGRLAPHDEASEQETRELGLEGRQLRETEIVEADGVILLSGVHGSPWLRGVQTFRQDGRRRRRVFTALWKRNRLERLIHLDGELETVEPF